MKAAVLTANGDPYKAFRLQEMPDPLLSDTQVLVEVDSFGLNFADVVARLGQYQDCPPLPTIIGYEVVGRVADWGKKVSGLQKGTRVVAFTRFGGYASKVATEAAAVVPIPDNMPDGEALALCTQYCTAYFAAEYITQLHEGEHVLVQSAAGGVGTALVQLAKLKGCIVYGTAGSDDKMAYLKAQGVDLAINYRDEDFAKVIAQIAPNGKLDVIFDAVGGSAVRKGIQLLDAGGRMVCYGAASMSDRKHNLLKTAKSALEFGLYHPAQFMMSSRSLLGVNMLRVADHKPLILQKCLQAVVKMAIEQKIKPTVDSIYPIEQLPEAHEKLEFRRTIGKVAIKW